MRDPPPQENHIVYGNMKNPNAFGGQLRSWNRFWWLPVNVHRPHCLYKGLRSVNRAVHMAFGSKIDHCIYLMILKDFCNGSSSQISSCSKNWYLQNPKIFRISSVSLFIQIGEFFRKHPPAKAWMKFTHRSRLQWPKSFSSRDLLFHLSSECRTTSTGRIPTPAFLAFSLSST